MSEALFEFNFWLDSGGGDVMIWEIASSRDIWSSHRRRLLPVGFSCSEVSFELSTG
jgi:hypothetical protein